MTVSENLQVIISSLPAGVTLVAVSKLQPQSAIMEAYGAGHFDFGENYIQELRDKQLSLPSDIRWHFIGHLQSNKVKYIAPFVHLIHGVDSPKLFREIEKQGQKIGRCIDVLLQVHISEEDTKFGFSESELLDFIDQIKEHPLQFVRIKGLMGMASFTEREDQIRSEMKQLSSLYHQLGNQYGGKTFGQVLYPYLEMSILSMGMSGDYPLALEYGSNLIRVGSAIFGARPPKPSST
ncbi:MAG TPA: YggS family pyridoxal phosphate-dependent enzyme [Luteibaculaceae bacterium]|nr:YggS family pyridoxal phosphate-dependent enzyme [Luteibaculaceae bacterium]